MKSIIIPASIILALIAFLVIVDRKEFKRHNDIQTVQRENLTVNRNLSLPIPKAGLVTEARSPVKAKLVAGLPLKETSVETKMVVDSKSVVDAKQADVNKSSPVALPVISPEEAMKANEEAKKIQRTNEMLAETNETVSFAETTVEDKPAPAAIPVLTREEAIKANKEAIRFQRNAATAKAIRAFCQKIGINKNRIHFFISLLPLLLIFDVLLPKRKKKTKNSRIIEYISLPRRICILLSVSLLIFGVLVFVPWSVYFGNSIQFPFIFQDFVNWNLRVLAFSIIIVSIVLLLIPPIISDYLVALVAGLGLCAYVQAMFMNQHLGIMNGIEPVWSEHRVFGTINLIIWIAIVLSPIVLRKVAPALFSKAISMTAGIVLFLEILATSSMVFSANQYVWLRKDTYFIDGSNQFQFSKEKNVVFFLMDALGSEYIERCFEEYPETKEIVKDFIWYSDARANYHMTFPGLIHELTGTMLPAPANTYYDLLEQMWHSKSVKSFYKQISDAGYDAKLNMQISKYTIGPEDYYHNYFSNIEEKEITYVIDHERLHHCLKQMSCFSFAPYFLKKYFFYAFDFSDNIVQMQVADIPSEKKWIPKTNSDFLKKMLSLGITSDANKPIVSFYYVYGAHIPWTHDEKCNKMDEPFDNPIPTTRGCFYLLSEFIRLLKGEKIYDNTAILLCSDHGGNDHGNGNGKYDLTLMIKPFNENKPELTIDTAKVQSIDILPTLLYLACGEKADFEDFEGFAPNNIPKDRVRKVYKFFYNKNLPSPDPDLDKGYPGCQGLEEYIFNDLKTFRLGKDSESFVRQIPLVISPTESNN